MIVHVNLLLAILLQTVLFLTSWFFKISKVFLTKHITPGIIHSDFGQTIAELDFGDLRTTTTFSNALAIDHNCVNPKAHRELCFDAEKEFNQGARTAKCDEYSSRKATLNSFCIISIILENYFILAKYTWFTMQGTRRFSLILDYTRLVLHLLTKE